MRSKQLLLGWLGLLFFSTGLLQAQILTDTDTLYGNEWLEAGQQYYRIGIAQDGIYRISYNAMQTAGIPVGEIPGGHYQLWNNGRQVPVYVSSEGRTMEDGDYIEFFGEKHLSQVDRFLFEDADREMLNPYYSLISDTSAYFLSWGDPSATNLRYTQEENATPTASQREPWYLRTTLINEHALFRDKRYDGTVTTYSDYESGEGFASPLSSTFSYTLPLENYRSNGQALDLTIRLTSHRFPGALQIKINGQVAKVDSTMDQYELRIYNFRVPVAPDATEVKIELEDLKDLRRNRYALSNIILTYPSRFVLEGDSTTYFELTGAGQVRYLACEGASPGTNYLVLDPVNKRRFQITASEQLDIVLPPTENATRLAIARTEQDIRVVDTIRRIVPADFSNSKANYLIVTHSLLREGAQAYADYRSSAEGGGYRVRIVEVDDLYFAFGYGINRHPLAIKNFANYMAKQWPEIEMALLMGKGIQYTMSRQFASFRVYNLVPTYGAPGSDHLLFSPMGKTQAVVPIGRLSARSNADVLLYLNKVKTYEQLQQLPRTFENHAWKKRMIHLVGGGVEEQPLYSTQLGSMERVAGRSQLGSVVYTARKFSAETVSSSVSDQVIEAVNQGVLIKTFLGHGAIEVTDFGLDDPELFNHQGKAPLSISLGCLTGDAYTDQISLSERFLFTSEDNGSIAYLASSGYGFVFALTINASEFYRLLTSTHFTKPIGATFHTVIGTMAKFTSAPNVSLSQQMNLHGDPAVRFFLYDEPDFVLDPKSVSFTPGILNTELDSFDLSFQLANIGAFRGDSLFVRISHELPEKDTTLHYDVLLQLQHAIQEFKIRLPVPDNSAGRNRMYIELDPNNLIPEFPEIAAEANNSLQLSNSPDPGIDFFILENGVSPLYPPDMGIIGTSSVRLEAVPSDLFARPLNYQIELDTLIQFDSPFKKVQKFNRHSGLLKWDLPFELENNKVYYWRVSVDSTDIRSGDFVWTTRSFLYQKDAAPGWNQSHRHQFRQNYSQHIQIDSIEGWQFKNARFGVIAESLLQSNLEGGHSRVLLNNDRVHRIGGSDKPFIGVMAFDSITGAPWVYPVTERTDNDFNANLSKDRKKLYKLLEAIPTNNYVTVVFYANEDGYVYDEGWEQDSIEFGTNIFQALEAQGAVSIRSFRTSPNVPYVFAYKKDAYPIDEAIGTNVPGRIRIQFDIPAIFPNGNMHTGPIGPAQRWETLTWEGGSEPSDSFTLRVIGLDEVQQTQTPLFDFTAKKSIDLSSINAAQYPYVYLDLQATDSTQRTPPSIDFWRINYQAAPSIRIIPLSFYRDTLERGEDLRLELLAVNYGGEIDDSMDVQYQIKDQGNKLFNFVKRIKIPGAFDSLRFEITFHTGELDGKAQISISYTFPSARATQFAGIKDFYVQSDRIPPVLEVTFDGRRIMNKELVSATPVISVELKDENVRFALEDTATIQMKLIYPDNRVRIIHLEDDDVVFTTSQNASTAVARLEFTPELLQDGIYQLQVNGKDAQGNVAGLLDYRIEFEVITTNSISNLLPYPNPFSTQTRFVYTLTGNAAPTYFLLRIMTPSGRIVREITQEEFGALQIGTHQSDFVWDGTDSYGDQLANGVYLYQVMVKDAQGEEYQHYERQADSFFKKNFGKIVLLR